MATLTDAESRVSANPSDEARIIDACEKKDYHELRNIATAPGGFISDELRSRAWPVLLGFNANEASQTSTKSSASWKKLPRHRDEDQVRLDVDRSFVYYPTYTTQTQLEEKRSELADMIVQVLREHPYLCYFQGYHDVCQVLLLVLPPSLRATALARLSVLRIRDYMLPTLMPALVQLRLIPDLIQIVDPKLGRHLSQSEPHFALADTLTMFAHNVQRYRDIARLFDALIAREQVFSLYVFAQIVLRRRDELLGQDEPDMLHFVLSKLPPDLDLDSVIAEAALLFEKHPPESLPSWGYISSASVLKTARSPEALARQSLRDGHMLFEKQVRELQWADRRQEMMRVLWKNRSILFTILVGVGAIYLRKASAWAGVMALLARLGRG